MTILVTAASGQLGRLVVDALLERGAQPADLVASARDTSKLADLAARDIRTVELDYSRPETIAAALDGVDTVLLISGSEPGSRLAGHRNVIDAAKAAGVAKLVYTSAPQATTADYALGADHKATEEAIAASGVPAVIVRHNWYTENYAADVARAASTGTIAASVADGRVASATRADFAAGDAAVLLEDGHLGQVYEFGGDDAWNYAELAAAASEVIGSRPTAGRGGRRARRWPCRHRPPAAWRSRRRLRRGAVVHVAKPRLHRLPAMYLDEEVADHVEAVLIGGPQIGAAAIRQPL